MEGYIKLDAAEFKVKPVSSVGRVKPAVEGEQFIATGVGGKQELKVGSKCSTNKGNWFCITHDKGFQDQFQKNVHIYQGQHILVWTCFEHGPEVP